MGDSWSDVRSGIVLLAELSAYVLVLLTVQAGLRALSACIVSADFYRWCITGTLVLVAAAEAAALREEHLAWFSAWSSGCALAHSTSVHRWMCGAGGALLLIAFVSAICSVWESHRLEVTAMLVALWATELYFTVRILTMFLFMGHRPLDKICKERGEDDRRATRSLLSMDREFRVRTLVMHVANMLIVFFVVQATQRVYDLLRGPAPAAPAPCRACGNPVVRRLLDTTATRADAWAVIIEELEAVFNTATLAFLILSAIEFDNFRTIARELRASHDLDSAQMRVYVLYLLVVFRVGGVLLLLSGFVVWVDIDGPSGIACWFQRNTTTEVRVLFGLGIGLIGLGTALQRFAQAGDRRRAWEKAQRRVLQRSGFVEPPSATLLELHF